MLEKVKTALLISDKPSFSESYRNLAGNADVTMHVTGTWCKRYRVTDDVVITGSVHAGDINEAYYNRTVIILKEGENPSPLMKKGISHFIFNYQNTSELLLALYREEPIVVMSSSREIKDILRDYSPIFCTDNYDFRFDTDIYKYKGVPIYLCTSQKKFLAEWLLAGHKDNKKRMILCNLRKKFGEDFLKDIDRFGQVIRRKGNEQ